MKITERIQHAWNAFNGKQDIVSLGDYGSGSSSAPHRGIRRFSTSSFSSAIFNRIALDASMTIIHHVKMDPITEDIQPFVSGLNECLTVEANIDQTSIQFVQDLVYSMFDEGVVAIVPVDTTISPNITGSYEINTMRVGRITQWYPKHVSVNLYNEETGQTEEITVPKASTAIVENPLYAIVNGPNATLSRLLQKMAMIDETDTAVSNGKLDLFIQLPYAVKTELQKTQANARVELLEAQLSRNKRGIAYTDATEKITQLSRPVSTTILEEVQDLNTQFYNQLGLTANVINGTASEAEMRTYYTRTIDPIIENIISEFNRKFLTKTARTQGQKLQAYRDPFKLVPLQQLIELGDTFRRNEIGTTNEIRRIIGMKTSNDPKADVLSNPNIAAKNNQTAQPGSLTPPDESSSPNQNE